MKFFILSIFIGGLMACKMEEKSPKTETQMIKNDPLTYLALGDSYTIGEGVEENERYPNLLIELLNKNTEDTYSKPKIIAKTGWTVDELDAGINNESIGGKTYDLVTLSIGVNNQYRGRSVKEYKVDFEQMLLKAIGFAGNLPDHVFVLSIPDWGVTPFARDNDKDSQKVANEIDDYNQAKKQVCEQYGVKYIDITEEYRQIGGKPEMVAGDQLHPSGLVYQSWSEKLFQSITNR